MTALMPIGLFDLQGKMEDRVRGLLDRRRDPGVRLTTQRRWGMLAAAAIFLAVAASFPLVAPVQAEKLAAAEQASSKPEQQRAIEASQNHTGGLPDPDHKPVAAPEKPAPAQYSRELVEARRRAVEFLVKWKDEGIESEFNGQDGGVAALVTLALLQSGVKPDDSRVSDLLARVRTFKPGLTYVTSLQTLVLCAAEPKKDLDAIRRNVKWLEETQLHSKEQSGAWSYGTIGPLYTRNVVGGDNSNTHFAMLALHEADLAGAAADEKTWLLALNHWLAAQSKDGSWSYLPHMQSSGSITCAGVACVAAAARRVKDKAKVEAAQAAVKRAEQWLTKFFTVEGNPIAGLGVVPLWHFYYLSDLERAARFTGQAEFGKHDWRQEGIRVLLKKQADDGSWKGARFVETDPAVATSLALLFLRPELPGKQR